MIEFTLRNKSTKPIMTLKPKMLAMMVAARPESVSLVLSKRMRDYKQLSGVELSLDYDQQQTLLSNTGADDRGIWTDRYSKIPHEFSEVKAIFSTGFLHRTLSESMSKDLALAEAFHLLLDSQIDVA